MRAALAVGLLATVVFVVLAVLVMTPFGIAFDATVLGGVHKTATAPVVAAMGLLTRLGNEFIIVALPLVLLWLWRRGPRQQAVEVLIATLGAQLLNDALTLTFHRPRPSVFVSVIPGQAFSFPSGHAMVSIAFCGPLTNLQGQVIGINTLVAGQAEPGVQAQGLASLSRSTPPGPSPISSLLPGMPHTHFSGSASLHSIQPSPPNSAPRRPVAPSSSRSRKAHRRPLASSLVT